MRETYPDATWFDLVRRLVVTPTGEPLVAEDGIEVLPFDQLVELVCEGTLYR